ncbi:hypothetical protein C7S18_08100 [Ahniella affigens]|uniref:Uncharacterized protein n=1 Tax=Ahniella affigens TaxID=2021234 RepID=A0A2P1PQM9_9GAMM|nr:type I polyketide synthase [Ahniella affigens]AVP97157.1 hypothetical protein C7S18_08100 [Ahniella affigens]
MHEPRDGIAIVGLAGRFAGSDDIDAFWNNLCAGRSGLRQFSREELSARGVPSEQLDHPDFVAAGAQFDGIDLFDAAFFDYAPREAEVCGPQQRQLLECVHRALEDAGCAPDKLQGRVGTFVGVGQSNYLTVNLGTHPELAQTVGARTVQFGNDNTFAATQIAYRLDLRGPAMGVATACSTSLVAVHLACRSLLEGECDAAIAGGAQISIEHDCGYQYYEGGIHSPDGHCRTFDADAQGTVSGNGAAAVVLRRLSDAIADGDRIYAVLRGSALSNDGNDKVGYAAPSVSGQAYAIARAQALAGVHPDQVGYVEAHGTATPLGDPIEIAGLTQAFRLRTQRRQYCAIGSLKSNLGHMGAAAGVGALIKTALAVHHGKIPASLDFKNPNPALALEQSPFFVNTSLCDWSDPLERRIAGVSSFGMGGTNAHAVLAGLQTPAATPPLRTSQPILLSAKSESALHELQRRLAGYALQHPDGCLADLAYSLAVGRRDWSWRRALVVDSPDALIDACQRPAGAKALGALPVVFMFPGQGAQHPGMAAQTYQNEPAFRDALDRCAEILNLHGIDLKRWLRSDVDRNDLDQTAIAQPVLFAVSYAYAQFWMSVGITPSAMIGHSLGEYVAATLAGVFDLDAALSLVVQRGALMQRMAPGAMLAVAASVSELRDVLAEDCELAAVNAERSAVLSGTKERLQAAANALEARGIACRWLAAQHAFHSSSMRPMLAAFRVEVEKAAPRAPTLRLWSNVTGEPLTAEQAMDPDYWVKQVQHTVRFADGIESLRREDRCLFLEVGPGQVLTRLLKQFVPAIVESAPSAPHAGSAADDSATLLAALAKLWESGYTLRYRALFSAQRRLKLAIPGHPLELRRFWIEPRLDAIGARADARFVAADASKATLYTPTWRQQRLAPRGIHPEDAWLIVSDGDSVATELVRSLAALGASVHVLGRAVEASWSALPVFHHHLDLDQSGALDAVKLDLVQAIGDAATIHLIVCREPVAPTRADASRQLVSYGFPIVRFLQALTEAKDTRRLRFTVVSPAAYALSDDDAVNPAAAAGFAATRVVGHELAETRGCHFDLGGNEAPPTQVAIAILAEHAADLPESVVAWRSGRRYVRAFQPVDPLPARANLLGLGENMWQGAEQSVWLITGGLGGIGLALARHLARRFRARLALVTRTPIPAKQEWNAWLATQAADNQTSKLIRALREIEAEGGELLVLAADIADASSVGYVAERVRNRFGRVDAVIHAAGVAEMHPLAMIEPDTLRQAVAAKTSALDHLHAAFGAELKLMLLCSSQNAFKGGIGKYAYCAGNAYLDAWAEAHANHVGYRLLSLNWCMWRDVGMAVGAGTEPIDPQRQRESISNDEAMLVFDTVLRQPEARLVVSKLPPEQVLSSFDRQQAAERDAMVAYTMQNRLDFSKRAAMRSDYAAPASLLEQQLCQIWTEVLGVEPIGVADNFFEVGGNSLLLTQVALRVRQRVAGTVSMQQLFGALTVREQAAQILAQQTNATSAEDLEAMLSELESLSEDEIQGLLNA